MTAIKSLLNDFRFKESSNRDSCQGIVDAVETTNIDVVVLPLDPEIGRALPKRGGLIRIGQRWPVENHMPGRYNLLD